MTPACPSRRYTKFMVHPARRFAVTIVAGLALVANSAACSSYRLGSGSGAVDSSNAISPAWCQLEPLPLFTPPGKPKNKKTSIVVGTLLVIGGLVAGVLIIAAIASKDDGS